MDISFELIGAVLAGFAIILFSRKFLSYFLKTEETRSEPGDQNVDDNIDGDAKNTKKQRAGKKSAVSGGGGGASSTVSRAKQANKVQHPWLLGSLKGHCGTVLDMQFSASGKYLATCAEDDESSKCSDVVSVSDSAIDDSRVVSAQVRCVTQLHSDTGAPSVSARVTKVTHAESVAGAAATTMTVSEEMADSERVYGAVRCDAKVDSIHESPSTLSCCSSLSESTTAPASNTTAVSSSSAVDGAGNQRRAGTRRRNKKCRSPPSTVSCTAAGDTGVGHLTLPPMSAECAYRLLTGYLLHSHQLQLLGYPHACAVRPGRAYIYRPAMGRAFRTPHTVLDAGAKEFVPRACRLKASTDTAFPAATSSSSLSSSPAGSEIPGGGSDSSSDSGVADDDNVSSSGSEGSEDAASPSSLPPAPADGASSAVQLCTPAVRGGGAPLLRPECARCGSVFAVSVDGVYADRPPQRCRYHWGKLRHSAGTGGGGGGCQQRRHQCCDGRPGSRGCSVAPCHVWSGLLTGLNGPLRGYVCTRPRRCRPLPLDVYALDCEMCYSGAGLQLARVSVVDVGGRRVYDTLVRPERPVVDYNVRYSGITQRRLSTATRTLRAVQSDLMGFISADTVLVGHGLENDLRALRLVHGRVIDTAVLFPHHRGLPYRHRLSHLTAACLKRNIQCDGGHDSLEDARACMQLVVWKLRQDLGL